MMYGVSGELLSGYRGREPPEEGEENVRSMSSPMKRRLIIDNILYEEAFKI